MSTQSPACADCGSAYSSFGVDVMLPDDQWSVLCPEGGLLCANCIAKRANIVGATVMLCWLEDFPAKQTNLG